VHFEIHAEDPERARAFYEKVFGWEFLQWHDEPYWLIRTGDEERGVDCGMFWDRRPVPPAATLVQTFTIVIDVPDLDASVKVAEAAGGQVIEPKGPVPGVGWQVCIRDTEGNSLRLMQADADVF
jgi:hypothetical protein